MGIFWIQDYLSLWHVVQNPWKDQMKLKLYNFYANNEKLYLLDLVRDGTMKFANVGEKVGKLLNTRFQIKCVTHKGSEGD